MGIAGPHQLNTCSCQNFNLLKQTNKLVKTDNGRFPLGRKFRGIPVRTPMEHAIIRKNFRYEPKICVPLGQVPSSRSLAMSVFPRIRLYRVGGEETWRILTAQASSVQNVGWFHRI